MTAHNALDRVCPTCAAPAQEGCRDTATGQWCTTHAARFSTAMPR